jgi:hypothetical protein
MKNIRRVIAIFLLVILYAYVVNINSFPETILLYKDSSLNIRLCPFITLAGEELTSSSGKSTNYNLGITLGNTTLKEVNVKLIDNVEAIPVRKFNRTQIIYERSYDCTVFLKLKI